MITKNFFSTFLPRKVEQKLSTVQAPCSHSSFAPRGYSFPLCAIPAAAGPRLPPESQTHCSCNTLAIVEKNHTFIFEVSVQRLSISLFTMLLRFPYDDYMPKKSVKSRGRKLSARLKPPRKSSKKIAKSKRVIFVFLGGAVALLFGILSLNVFPQKFCANSISCIKDLSGTFEKNAATGTFEGKTVSVPSLSELAYTNLEKNVLGTSTGTKTIKVDLSSQHLYAYEGDRVVMDFPVSTGKWHLTPTGTFNIWIKLRYTRMTGGSGADYYNLPNVPYVMFFSNADTPKSDGYSIHGAYWHNNFGHPMSHGCINMRIADAGELFAWADPPTNGYTTLATSSNPGTQVVIYGTTPTN